MAASAAKADQNKQKDRYSMNALLKHNDAKAQK